MFVNIKSKQNWNAKCQNNNTNVYWNAWTLITKNYFAIFVWNQCDLSHLCRHIFVFIEFTKTNWVLMSQHFCIDKSRFSNQFYQSVLLIRFTNKFYKQILQIKFTNQIYKSILQNMKKFILAFAQFIISINEKDFTRHWHFNFFNSCFHKLKYSTHICLAQLIENKIWHNCHIQ